MKRTSWLVVDLFIPILSAVGIILLFQRFMYLLDLDTKAPLPTDLIAGYMFGLAGIAAVVGIPIAILDLIKGSKVRGIISIILVVLTWPFAYFMCALMGLAMA